MIKCAGMFYKAIYIFAYLGTISLSHFNWSILFVFTACFFWGYQDDLSFKLEYAHPYLDGVEDRSRNRTFKASCFNVKKLSPVFVAGPNMDEAPTWTQVV